MKENNLKNAVTIRIWNMNPLKKEVGHVSLETHSGGEEGDGIYASFWPDLPTKIDGEFDGPEYVVAKKGKSFLRTSKYDKDCYKGKKRSYKERVYSLDIDKINTAFYKFKESEFVWDLASTSIFHHVEGFLKKIWAILTRKEFENQESTSNCAGLVLLLLKAGGIDKYFGWEASFLRSGLLGAVIGGVCGAVSGAALSGVLPAPAIPKQIFTLSGIFCTQVLVSAIEVFFCLAIKCLWSVVGPVSGGVFGLLSGAILGAITATVMDHSQMPDLALVTPSDLKRLINDLKSIEGGDRNAIFKNTFAFFSRKNSSKESVSENPADLANMLLVSKRCSQ